MPLNYIGSKARLLPFIDSAWREVRDGDERTVCDLFAGSGAVAQHFARAGYLVTANDLQHYSYVLNAAYLIGPPPRLERLVRAAGLPGEDPPAEAISFLAALPPSSGFLSRNYGPEGGRLYFSAENAARLDAARERLRQWHEEGLVVAGEHEYLLASLLEAADRVANTASVYNAYLKRLKATASQPLRLRPIAPAGSGRACRRDANDLVHEAECDLLYLDPPYNTRQYGAYYHVLETIALGDEPVLHGVTGMRDYPRSRYCRPHEVRAAFADLVASARARHILV
ncbi:MAG TPA: DNA adenine methylase, partial [Deinococcales bacterium]|nr:DNA adenine methylase [Deinococcales bacterium]